MRYFSVLVFLFSANNVLAIPTLQSRAITGPTQSYTCDINGSNQAFSEAYITSCITEAASTKSNTDMLKAMTTCDLSSTHSRDLAFCQPKEYKNHLVAGVGVLNFPNCPTGPWYEFPMMSNGITIYQGPSAPGRDNPARVIFQYTDETTAKFCGAIVHSTTVHGDFISCT